MSRYLPINGAGGRSTAQTTHVTMVQAFGFQYLTFDGSGIALHGTMNHPANFHLSQVQDPMTMAFKRYLEVYNAPHLKLHQPFSPPVNCSVTTSVTVSSTLSSEVKTTSGSTDVMLFFEDDVTGEKLYLRVNLFGGNTVELVCQQHVDNVMITGGTALKEVQFSLILVDENDIIGGNGNFVQPPPTNYNHIGDIVGPFKPIITIPLKPGDRHGDLDYDLEGPTRFERRGGPRSRAPSRSTPGTGGRNSLVRMDSLRYRHRSGSLGSDSDSHDESESYGGVAYSGGRGYNDDDVIGGPGGNKVRQLKEWWEAQMM